MATVSGMSGRAQIENFAGFTGAGAAESDFLKWVKHRQAQALAAGPDRGVIHAAGDDLAVLEWRGGLVLVGVDPVLDGVHVEVARHGTRAAGRKAMNRNLSDVAAMGAEPVAATLSLAVPRAMGLQQVKEAYLGAEEAGAAAGCPIVGGDFSTWEGRMAVTVGILARADGPVLRERAKVGQRIFVTGPLGGSILGRHLVFAPRLDIGRRIAREYGASAMIDISDGLSVDLPRLLGPRLGATIDAAAVPVHEDARRLASQTGREALWHALNDGEDYELLFTAEAESLAGCTAIGRVEAEPGVRLQRDGRAQAMVAEGWEHRLSS